ncbi:DUF2200 family protein [Streptococcus himalayensis]|uniref:Uncharacterized protein n=1 Tax=Streptococcus himalayensis TaxID=1888195 RepID=A0A917A930_9STRE|nr:DUF2200 family protein [Streptococcus himalayensis]GGE36068.1 hypothetical protein GCM10011510_16760 [Streptococcus himalayensis]
MSDRLYHTRQKSKSDGLTQLTFVIPAVSLPGQSLILKSIRCVFTSIYDAYLNKVGKQEELAQVIYWLMGDDEKSLIEKLCRGVSVRDFFFIFQSPSRCE